MRNISLLLLVLWSCTMRTPQTWTTVEKPWPESLGNHRAVLEIAEPADAVELNLVWRRHDPNPAGKKFIILHESGDTIPEIRRIFVDKERCHLVFGPVNKPGKYYFYYLPYEVQENYGFFDKDYLKPEQNWENNGLETPVTQNLPLAKLIEFQSRTAFDSFYPMEIIALQAEKDSLLKSNNSDFLVFPEDRKFPIRMLDEIPGKWIESGPSGAFRGEAQKNEYYAFHLGIFAAQKGLTGLKTEFSPLTGKHGEISAARLTCFNTGGVDPYGNPFVKQVNVEKGKVQPLWIGVDVPENCSSGTYTGTVTVSAENTVPQTILVNLKIQNPILADRGDNEP